MNMHKDNYEHRTYIAIDLKSFYASVECIERGLDPLTTKLVVADESRTDKTICLAVTPALKALGVPGRCRLFEVKQLVREPFIIATPRMAYYLKYSTNIYNVYLKYVAAEDIHVYSIDEVFMDLTAYLKLYDLSAHDLTIKIIKDVLRTTGITATAGIGTNLYLAKVAMDIMAKKKPADEDGVRIAELDERSYRLELWDHKPLRDFWRVGGGYVKRLQSVGLYTMGDIARCSLGTDADYHNEDLLYKLFGINAELLIDHAWGYEECHMEDIKKFKPKSSSTGSGQVLMRAYTFEETRVVAQEMTEALVLDLVVRGLVTNQVLLHIGFDKDCLADPEIRKNYKGPIKKDFYGELVPKSAHGMVNLSSFTSSTRQIVQAVLSVFDEIVDPSLLARRVTVVANRVMDKQEAKYHTPYEQMSLFDMIHEQKEDPISDGEGIKGEPKREEYLTEERRKEEQKKEELEQEAILSIRKRFGKNAILKGLNFREGATGRERNRQIGGHKE